MGANHASLGFDGAGSLLVDVAPAVKVATAVAVVASVALVPADAPWVLVFHGVVVLVGLRTAQVSLRSIGRRARIVAPFVVGAALLPFLASGERVDIVGLSVSRPGLAAAIVVIGKVLVGFTAGAALVMTTEPVDIVRGLQQLRVPRTFTTIAGLMLRFADVLRGESSRMQIARIARGDDPRSIAQVRATARTAGVLFVRGYERGERVHQSMIARGWSGAMPDTSKRSVPIEDWFRVGSWGAVAVFITAFGWMTVG